MAVNSLGATSLRVLANTSAFEQSLKRSIGRVGKATVALFAAIGAEKFFGSAISDAVDLQKQIKQIQTLLTTKSDAAQAGLFSAANIRDVSNQIGISAGQVADSLYLILSSGIDASKAMDTLVAASKGAIATGSDLKQTVDFTTSAMNAYGGMIDPVTNKVYDAARANDILFKALQYGKGTLNDFSKYISSAIPIASQLKVSLEDLAGAAALNTLTGSTARKVFTGIKVSLQGLTDTTKGSGKAFQQIMGVDFPTYIKNGGNLEAAMVKMTKAVKGGAGSLTNLGGAKEGLASIQNLVSQVKSIPKVVKGLGTASEGAAAKAADQVNKSVSRQLEFVKIRFKNFRGSIGDWLIPVLTSALIDLDKFRQKWDAVWAKMKPGIASFIDSVKQGIDKFGPLFKNGFDLIKQALAGIDWSALGAEIKAVFEGIAIGLAPFLVAFGAVLTVIGQVSNVLGPLVSVLSPLKPLLFGIAAATTAYWVATKLLVFWTKENVIAQAAMALWTGIQVIAMTIAIGVTEGLGTAMLFLSAAMDVNPIVLVGLAIAALAAAFIYAYKHSDKFRTIVEKTFNAVVTVAGVAVVAFIKLMTAWGLAPIYAIDGILKALAHLPKHFGGGVASGAEAAVSALIGQINSWRDAAINAIDDVIAKAKMIPNQFGSDPDANAAPNAWNSSASFVSKTLKNQFPLGSIYNPRKATPVPAVGGGGGGGTYDPNAAAGKASAAAAKASAAAIKKAKTQIPKDLAAILKNITTQTSDQIKTKFDKLFADVVAAGKKVPQAWKDWAKTLEKDATKLAGIKDKLKLAQDAVQGLRDQSKAFTDSIISSFTDLADVTKTGYSSIDGLIFRMSEVVTQSKKFHDAVVALSKTNIDKGILGQIIAAGPAAGLASAQGILAGGQAGIDALNGMQAQINGFAADTAKIATDTLHPEFSAAGIAIADGIVTGLQNSEAKVVAAMTALAQKTVSAAKKVFKIASPSKIFHEMGTQLPAGLANGIAAGLGDVSIAGAALHGAATEGANGISPVSGGVPNIQVYIGDQELTGMIRVEMNSKNRNTKARASARSRSGVVAGSRGA